MNSIVKGSYGLLIMTFWRFFFTANGIADEDKRKAIPLSTSGPETYALLRNICAPDNPSTKSYAQFKQLMQDHLFFLYNITKGYRLQ